MTKKPELPPFMAEDPDGWEEISLDDLNPECPYRNATLKDTTDILLGLSDRLGEAEKLLGLDGNLNVIPQYVQRKWSREWILWTTILHGLRDITPGLGEQIRAQTEAFTSFMRQKMSDVDTDDFAPPPKPEPEASKDTKEPTPEEKAKERKKKLN